MRNSVKIKRCLLTGGTGYVGSNLARHLVKCGWDVHVITRSGSSLNALTGLIDQIRIYQHDGSSRGMVELVKTINPDTVFHLASLFLAQHKTDDVDTLINSNLLFATQLVEAMAVNGVKHLVNTGTSWQHYNNVDYAPVNLYAATKQAFESILEYYVETSGIKAVTLKLFDTYGPNDPRAKLISLLWRAAITQEELEMSPGMQMIDLVHINDVVRAFTLVANNMKNQTEGHTSYGVSSGIVMTIRDLVKEFENATSVTLPIKFGARPYRPREVMVPWSMYKSVPGWRPEIKLKDGIKDTKPSILK